MNNMFYGLVFQATVLNGEDVVEGFYCDETLCKDPDRNHGIYDKFSNREEIDPLTLKVSFDGLLWYSTEEAKKRVAASHFFDAEIKAIEECG
jgi:hypothetical protein